MLKVTKRKGSPYWQITGTVEGVRVRESSGTAVKAEAEKIAYKIAANIKQENHGEKTFAHAAIAYITAGGDKRFLKKPIELLGDTLLSEIDQALIDTKAKEAYPGYKRGPKGKLITHSKATIRRQWHVPVAAVMHYAAQAKLVSYQKITLPKAPRPAPDWADTRWFGEFLKHADAPLRAIVIFLMGTGCRISEVLNLTVADVHLDQQSAYVRTSKNGEPREVHLPAFVMREITPFLEGERVFDMYNSRFNVNNAIKRTCAKAKIKYLSTHKVGSHTFATNLARLAKMDSKALTETGRWKDPKSTHHYTHFLKREQAQKADSLEELLG